jgi:hypothetical protein
MHDWSLVVIYVKIEKSMEWRKFLASIQAF